MMARWSKWFTESVGRWTKAFHFTALTAEEWRGMKTAVANVRIVFLKGCVNNHEHRFTTC